MRSLVVLGSTGSIGKNTLAVAQHLGTDKVKVRGLAAHSNITLLAQQIDSFNPEVVAVYDKDAAYRLQKSYPHLAVLTGLEGICTLASLDSKPLVIAALSGSIGIQPTVSAICAGNDVALANKEVLVAAGAYVTSLARQHGVSLLPIDSEHSAIFQCLQGISHAQIRRLILTASGGPFRGYTIEQLATVTAAQALKHPNWSMGQKNTIDSSTLMNKGLEVIEAHWLFDIPLSSIEVVVHPQSIIHSMVECVDSSILAQMGVPDMQLPIQYAITYPERMKSPLKPFDFTQQHSLEFYPVDLERFKCLKLAYQALKAGDSFPCFLNAANEVFVQRFLAGDISWLSIGNGLERLLEEHSPQNLHALEDILAVDGEARRMAAEYR
jgi:1-deoxy-D-xylulose-5-phosphate reductoisomerase